MKKNDEVTQMSYEYYLSALKLGQKELQNRLSRNEDPYLPVLEEILGRNMADAEVYLGVMQIPLDEIVGTYTKGRSSTFAANFMPVMEAYTEFARKWNVLSDAHMETGIRDSIKCYEYMNRYYVLEGNKRVSVLKFFHAVSINAEVTRIVPPYSEDDPAIRVYYEYMDFYRTSKVHYLHCAKEGSYQSILRLCNLAEADQWTEDARKDFRSVWSYFSQAYENVFKNTFTHILAGDAFSKYLEVYGYTPSVKTASDLEREILNIKGELQLMDQEEETMLAVFAPSDTEKAPRHLFRRSTAPVHIGFVYDIKGNFITKAHDRARIHAEEVFENQIRTYTLDGVLSGTGDPVKLIEDFLLENSCQILFITSPLLREFAATIAVKYPKVMVLNCNLSHSSAHIRSYFGRMYEAQFVEGAIAGALSKTGHIGYFGDFPNEGMLSNINAFTRGAVMIRPDSKVHVFWPVFDDLDLEAVLETSNIDLVEYQTNIVHDGAFVAPGLYHVGTYDTAQRISHTYWNWDLFYEKMIRNLLNGSWRRNSSDQVKSVTYWWGLSSGVVNIEWTEQIPEVTRHMIDFIKRGTADWEIDPFDGPVRDQAGHVRGGVDGHGLQTEERLHMDWLIEGTIGDIPSISSRGQRWIKLDR